MKKILAYIIVTVFLATSCLFAIDKKASLKEKPADPTASDSLITDNSKHGVKTGKPQTGRDYNDFKDSNNNGIDDRAEKPKKKLAPPSDDIEKSDTTQVDGK